MRRLYLFTLCAAIYLAAASLNPLLHAETFKSPSINGATGLISTPTAHTGWEGNNMGLDMGMHYISDGDGYYSPKFSVQLFNKWEIGGTYDLQPPEKSNDLLLHSKFHFNASGTDLAVGGNFQMMKQYGQSSNFYQFYLAATYPGNFFTMPAETTIVIGKTFGDNVDDSNVDFSMGFDLDFLPNLFQHYVHWINDFSNYSYSVQAGGANAWSRGCFNTGIRLALLRSGRYKFNLDLLMIDALDSNRSFGAGAAFGLAL